MHPGEAVQEVVLEHSGGRLEDFGATHQPPDYRSRWLPVSKKWRVAALALLAAFVPAAGGVAADRTGESETAVAFQAPNGKSVRLTVQKAAPGLVCRDLTVGGETIRDEVCSEPPAIKADELTPVVVRVGGLTVLYGATRGATRRVELIVDGRRKPVSTVAVDGFRGRFYATAFAGEDAVLGGIALRDRTGVVTAATDIERAALPLAGRRVRLASIEDFERKRNALFALAPKVLANADRSPTRRKTALCVAIRSDLGVPAVQECAERRSQVQITYVRGCKDPHIVLYGVAPEFVTAAQAVYGSGRRQALDVHRVPKSVGRPGSILFGSREGKAPLKRVLVFNRAGVQLGSVSVRRTRCTPGDDVVGGGIAR